MERLRANEPLTIYLVDDEAAVRTLLTRVLQRNGFETQCFGTADQARMAITRAGSTRDPVDVVLLDMPLESGTDSTESAEDLLEMVTRRQPPPAVVAMSAHLSSDGFFRLILKGATDFVSKPWKTNEPLKAGPRLRHRRTAEGPGTTISSARRCREFSAMRPRAIPPAIPTWRSG